MPIAMLPVDTSRLPDISGTDVLMFKPSIAHSMIPCDRCGQDSWIGPRQLKARFLTGAECVCYYCIFNDPELLAATVNLVALNPNEGDIPRRT